MTGYGPRAVGGNEAFLQVALLMVLITETQTLAELLFFVGDWFDNRALEIP